MNYKTFNLSINTEVYQQCLHADVKGFPKGNQKHYLQQNYSQTSFHKFIYKKS